MKLKQTVEIEAIQYNSNIEEIISFLGDSYYSHYVHDEHVDLLLHGYSFILPKNAYLVLNEEGKFCSYSTIEGFEQTSALELTEDESIVLSALLTVTIEKTKGMKTQPYLVSIGNKVKKLNEVFNCKVD